MDHHIKLLKKELKQYQQAQKNQREEIIETSSKLVEEEITSKIIPFIEHNKETDDKFIKVESEVNRID